MKASRIANVRSRPPGLAHASHDGLCDIVLDHESVEYPAMLKRIVSTGFICALGAAGWALHAASLSEQDGFLRWRDSQVTVAGRVLYGRHCSSCHGMPDGSAMPEAAIAGKPAPPHDETGHTWQHPDFALFQLVRDGVAVANCVPVDPELMPSFRGRVSDPELVAILSYIKSTWPDDTRRNHDQVNTMYGAYNRAVAELIDLDLVGRN